MRVATSGRGPFPLIEMLQWLIVLAVLFVLMGTTFGQTLTLPATVRGEPDEFVQIKSNTDCPSVRWVALDPGLSVFPIELLKDSKTLVVIGRKAGNYRVLAYGAKNNIATDPAICTVVIGGQPGPGPEPKPPEPLPPVDEFAKAIRDAYTNDQRQDKSTHLDRLIVIFGRAQTYAVDSNLHTAGSLYEKISSERKAAMPDTALVAVRMAINARLDATLPTTTNELLTDAIRATAVTEFKKIESALKGARQ